MSTALVALVLGISPARGGELPAQPSPERPSARAGDAGGTSELRWHTRVDDAVAEAEKTGRYILVDLFADWCGWCHRLEKEVFTHPDFEAYAQDFVLLRVDTEDGAEGSWLQLRYGAESLPTTLVLDSDLVRVGTVSGFAPMPTFVEYLEEQINGYLAILSFYDRLIESDDAELQRQIAGELHERGAGEMAAELYQRVIDQVRRGTDAEAWLTYQMADAYRLSRRFDDARRHLAAAMRMARRLPAPDGTDLTERLDLLSVHLAQESGDCQGAVTSLEHFISEHPGSVHSQYAEQTLEAIKNGEVMDQCT